MLVNYQKSTTAEQAYHTIFMECLILFLAEQESVVYHHLSQVEK